MEKNGCLGEQFYRPVNHFGWKDVGNILTLGVSGAIAGDAKESRAGIERRQFEILCRGLEQAYLNPTAETINVSTEGGTMVLNRVDFLKGLPASMLDPRDGRVTEVAYLWARQHIAHIWGGRTVADVERAYGLAYQPVDLSGKMDWKTILKQAGVMIGALIATVATAGIAAPAAVGAVKSVIDLQKMSDQNKIIKMIGGIAQTSANETTQKIAAENVAIENQNKQAAMFSSPTIIMVLMAVGVLGLAFIAKKYS